ncbi:MAG: hypothetical protein KGS72_00265 [Cyanobacteria bacterium REEB67]|nr:hypothetical protein [Cyanobacteria bacterium REEB67]
MIRQHHLRISDIKSYLRTFDRHKPLSPDEWAVQESNLYEPGYLVFCLESVAPPAGLSTFSKRGEEQGETFRVKDFCVIVSKDDGKCVAVIVSPSAYEFRVLDSLLLEKAMRAILDGRDFHYLAARPVQKMDGEQIKMLYKLGSNYAKGGSRRSLIAEGATLQEPAVALLGQLGAKLSAQVGKQLLDIGSVCHMIFTPEGRQEDKSKSIIKSCFVPVRAEDDGAAPKAPQPSGEGQPLYSIDPMAQENAAQQNYSTAAGNIDLSALAPDPTANFDPTAAPESSAGQSAFESPAGAFMPNPIAEVPPPAGEPSSNFGDFGMGLLSALAPEQSNALNSMQNFAGPEATSLPSVGDMAANMDTLPPSGPTSTYADMSSMDSLDRNGFTNPGSSFTRLSGIPEMPLTQPADAATASTPATAPSGNMSDLTDLKNLAELTKLNAQAAAQTPASAQAARASTPARFPASASQVNIPAAMPQPVRQGGSAPPWYIMSHDAILAPSGTMAPTAGAAPQGDPRTSQNALAAQTAQSATPAASQLQVQPQAEPAPREDFSQQFLSDYEQGHAGAAAIDAAEREIAEEQRIKAENERGKDQRLKEYFGEEHFQKYVKGDAGEPEAGKVDSWQLDPNQYKAPAAPAGPDFDSDIFANAGRSTLETNPDAIVHEAPREEITGPPPDPSWAVPSLLAPPENESKGDQKAENSFDQMLTAGGAIVAPQSDLSYGSGAPGEVPNLGILDALQPEESPVTATGQQELGAPRIADDSTASSAGANSLFDRLTGELSKEPASVDDMDLSAPVADSDLSAAPLTGSVDEPAPTTVNWAPESDINGGSLWPSISPGESLFARPEEEISMPDEPTIAGAQAGVNPLDLPAPGRAHNESSVAPDQSSDVEIKSEVARAEVNTAFDLIESPDAAAPINSSINVDASAQPSLEANSEPGVSPEASAELRAEPTAEATSDFAAPTDSQQPRVRPRDYSSPLRSPRPLTSHSPLSRPNSTPTGAPNNAPSNAPNNTSVPFVQNAQSAASSTESLVENEQPQAASITAPAQSIATPAEETLPSPVLSTESAPPASRPLARSRSLTASSDSNPALGAAASSQDQRLMMNEMTSLMSKLELQVAKAANKMASRADELRGRLSQQVDSLVKEAQDVEKQAEANLVNLASEFKAKLDTLSTEVQTNLTKEGTSAQDAMEALAQSGWDELEAEQTHLTEEIKRSSDLFRLDLERLTNAISHRLDTLIESRNKELESLSDQILTQLKETQDAYNAKITQRYERFEQRTNEETSSISTSLERNMRAMVEEIESSLERAVEKLKNTRFELEQTVAHTIAVSEMAIAQKAKLLLTETLLPRLNEHKEIIRTMISDMTKQIINESTSSLDTEVARLDQGTSDAADKLRKVAEECVSEVEMTGRGIKTGLEENFKRVSSDLMVRTREVGDKIRETERRMADSEYALKGLAESSSVDSEPELAEERNHAVTKLASLKLEASKQLAAAIEDNIEHLDSEGERLFSELSNNRSELTTQIREAAEMNISKIRQALQEATSAIQTAREKHME